MTSMRLHFIKYLRQQINTFIKNKYLSRTNICHTINEINNAWDEISVNIKYQCSEKFCLIKSNAKIFSMIIKIMEKIGILIIYVIKILIEENLQYIHRVGVIKFINPKRTIKIKLGSLSTMSQIFDIQNISYLYCRKINLFFFFFLARVLWYAKFLYQRLAFWAKQTVEMRLYMTRQ